MGLLACVRFPAIYHSLNDFLWNAVIVSICPCTMDYAKGNPVFGAECDVGQELPKMGEGISYYCPVRVKKKELYSCLTKGVCHLQEARVEGICAIWQVEESICLDKLVIGKAFSSKRRLTRAWEAADDYEFSHVLPPPALLTCPFYHGFVSSDLMDSSMFSARKFIRWGMSTPVPPTVARWEHALRPVDSTLINIPRSRLRPILVKFYVLLEEVLCLL